MIIFVIALLTSTIQCLRFSYNLLPGYSQCFYEIVERNSRFQIIVRSSSPDVGVNIFTPNHTISNLVDPDTFQKSYAGFSDDNDQVHFCLSNPSSQKTKSLIQFYHGLNLQSVGQVISSTDFNMVKSVNQNLRQITQLLSQNFKFYNERMRSRVLKYQGVSWSYNIVTILLIVIISAFSFYQVFTFKKFLKNKKYI